MPKTMTKEQEQALLDKAFPNGWHFADARMMSADNKEAYRGGTFSRTTTIFASPDDNKLGETRMKPANGGKGRRTTSITADNHPELYKTCAGLDAMRSFVIADALSGPGYAASQSSTALSSTWSTRRRSPT